MLAASARHTRTALAWQLHSANCIRRSFSRVGESASAVRTWTSDDVASFAALTHDDNPIHADDDFTAEARFGRPIVHGMLHASMFGSIVGQRCPGAVYVSQTLRFRNPVHVGDTVTAEIVVQRVGGRGRLIEFATRSSKPGEEGEVIIVEGAARVLMPRTRIES